MRVDVGARRPPWHTVGMLTELPGIAVIDRADVEHHMVTRMYVDQVVQRRS